MKNLCWKILLEVQLLFFGCAFFQIPLHNFLHEMSKTIFGWYARSVFRVRSRSTLFRSQLIDGAQERNQCKVAVACTARRQNKRTDDCRCQYLIQKAIIRVVKAWNLENKKIVDVIVRARTKSLENVLATCSNFRTWWSFTFDQFFQPDWASRTIYLVLFRSSIN